MSYAESRRKWAKAKDGTMMTKPDGIPYKDVVEQARLYIHTIGGFEKFAEWGLIRSNTDLTD